MYNDANGIIQDFRSTIPVPAPTPRPVTSSACQTHEFKAEAEVTQVKFPTPPGDITISAKDHMVYMGAMANVKRLIKTSHQLKTELTSSKEETRISNEANCATAQLTAECDALRQLRETTEERHAKELARAARAG